MTSSISTWRLLAYETRRVLKSSAAWVTLGVLLVAGTWGALNAARLHADQHDDLTRIAKEEADWYSDVRTRAARYAQPSSTPLPYWQDPTGASGFSRYFLRRVAAKPHLPLSVLAVGQSDLQPFAVPIRLETLFGGDRVYDYEPPRALATGLFDLGFVLVFVLPLSIGATAATIGAHERDQGVLAFVAAQPLSPRRWWSVRLIALAAVLIPGVAIAVVVALAIAGAPVLGAWLESLAAVALVAALTLVWLSIAVWCLARGQGAIATMSTVGATWLVLTVAAPLVGSLAVRAMTRPPSPVADVNDLRRTTDDVQREADAVVARRLAKHLGPTAASVNPSSLDYSTRLVLITQEMEARLQAQERRRQQHGRAANEIARIASWLSPQVAFHDGLVDLAGTGTARHLAFLQSVRAFQLELRGFMYPRVLEPLRSAPRPVCSSCPGRFTFTDYDDIPRFTMHDATSSARVGSALRTASWLGFVAVAIAVVGIGRGTTWALGSSA